MSQTGDARIVALDEILDRVGAEPTLSSDLFAAADALSSSAALRKALSDPGIDPQARRGLAHGVFDAKLSAGAVQVVAESAALRWSSPSALVAGIEREGVRAEVLIAERDGTLEELEDELFRFARVVEGDPGLRDAIGNRAAPLPVRRQLITDLLGDRAGESTVRLASRAVTARERTFAITIEGYQRLLAAHQRRTIATVRVARPLSEEQTERLTAALGTSLGRPVLIQVVVDPTVIGGVRVEVGDEVIEGTVAGRLDQARRSLGA